MGGGQLCYTRPSSALGQPVESYDLRCVARVEHGGGRSPARGGPLGSLGRQLPAVGVHRRPPRHDIHRRLVHHLAGTSARWAPTASLLVANLSHRLVEDTDWDYSEFPRDQLVRFLISGFGVRVPDCAPRSILISGDVPEASPLSQVRGLPRSGPALPSTRAGLVRLPRSPVRVGRRRARPGRRQPDGRRDTRPSPPSGRQRPRRRRRTRRTARR